MSAQPLKVAALYVDPKRGPYAGIEGVDVWGVDRDARLYRGPLPVVAHPPCKGWGVFRVMRWVAADRHKRLNSDRLNADSAELGCGPIAVHQVRTLGGILEHPAASHLWAYCGLPRPGELPDRWGGVTIEITQGSFGHPAPKLTWLYCVGCDPWPELILPRADPGGRVCSQWSDERHLTPPLLAEALVDVAARATRRKAGHA